MSKMLEVLRASHSISYDHPLPKEIKEFIGKVEVKVLERKGRGLIATDNFAPGDLIIAQRAIAIIYPDQKSTISSLLSKVKKFRLLKEAIAKLVSESEEQAIKIYSLHAGPKLGVIDKSRISQGFNCKVNMARIEGILLVNGFQGSKREASEGPFGLWYLPSFINHDCFKTNANWEIFNDFMFIRASKVIKKGEEMLIRNS